MTDLQKAENYIALHLSEKRLSHVRSVCDTAVSMCRVLDRADYGTAAYTAALLHDITKEYNNEKQLAIIQRHSLGLTEEDMQCPEILHSFTGAALSRELFPETVSGEIYGAIYNHTTGKEDMSFLEKIIFLADYIEPKRKYEASHELYDYFMSNTDDKNALDKACLRCLTNTVTYLGQKGGHINSRTLRAKKYLEERLKQNGKHYE